MQQAKHRPWPNVYPSMQARLAFPFAFALAACTSERAGPVDVTTVIALSPKAEAQLVEELGDFQSPGPNSSDGLRDEHGTPSKLPDGVTFASTVDDFEPGTPAPIADATNPETALGSPDYRVNRQSGARAV